MLTYSELFEFCLVVIGIIGLCFQAKKKYPPHASPSRRLLFEQLTGELTVYRQRPLLAFILTAGTLTSTAITSKNS